MAGWGGGGGGVGGGVAHTAFSKLFTYLEICRNEPTTKQKNGYKKYVATKKSGFIFLVCAVIKLILQNLSVNGDDKICHTINKLRSLSVHRETN